MPDLAIDEIVVGKRYRRDLGDIKALCDSIGSEGLLQPIVVDSENRLIAGFRRIEAFKRLNRTKIPVHRVDLDTIVRGEYAENVIRKDFTITEKLAIGAALEPLERKAAKEREKAGKGAGGSGGRGKKKPSGKLPEGFGDTRDAVARKLGMSGKSYEKAKAIQASGNETLIARMEKGGKVSGIYNAMKKAEQAKAIREEPLPLPKGPFRVIVVDPPWPYGARADDVTHRAANPYPTESIDELKGKPIAAMSHDNCVLWLWTTNAFMREAWEICGAWGFDVKTILTWVKDRMGTGDWLRGQTEHALMAVRGKPVVTLTNQTTVIHGKLREHSRKPDEFYRLVESLCPGSKCELYGREKRKDWTVHGSEIDKFS